MATTTSGKTRRRVTPRLSELQKGVKVVCIIGEYSKSHFSWYMYNVGYVFEAVMAENPKDGRSQTSCLIRTLEDEVKRIQRADIQLFDGAVIPPVKPLAALMPFARRRIQKHLDEGYRAIALCVSRTSLGYYTAEAYQGVCHGFMASGMGTPQSVFTYPNRAMWAGLTKRTGDRYLKFLANRSLYADAFLTKHPPVTVPVYEMDINQPANYLQGALIASRQPHENPLAVNMWDRLVKLGTPENLALFISQLTNEFHVQGDDVPRIRMTKVPGAHTPLDPRGWSQKMVVKYGKNGKGTNPNPPYVERRRYEGVFKLYQKPKEGHFQGQLQKQTSCPMVSTRLNVGWGEESVTRRVGEFRNLDDAARTLSVWAQETYPELYEEAVNA